MEKMTEDDKGVILSQILADVICERSLRVSMDQRKSQCSI